jgi:YD repeat-containing protein
MTSESKEDCINWNEVVSAMVGAATVLAMIFMLVTYKGDHKKLVVVVTIVIGAVLAAAFNILPKVLTSTENDYIAAMAKVNHDLLISTRQKELTEGSIKTVMWYDEKGRIARNSDGYVIVEYTYDANGNLTREGYYNAKHEPVYLKDKAYSYYTQEFNDDGKVNRIDYYDTEGKRTMNLDSYASESRIYESHGENIVEYRYFYGTDMSPVMLKEYRYH